MYKGHPYLDAFAWEHKRICCFKLCRVSEVRFTGLTFTDYRDYDFSVQHQDCFGIYSDQEPLDVRVRFSAKAAPYILEEFMHHTQTITQNPDGSIEYSVRVSEPREVLWWTLSWGEEGEILEPSWLREHAREKIQKMLEKYQEG